MEWLSINDVKRLVKQKVYQLETGSKPGDSLVYDSRSRQYVGHIEQSRNTFHQNASYTPPSYVIETLQAFDGNSPTDWRNNRNANGWGGSDGWGI